MIDMHTHILPGIDDGPSTMAEALAMARLAVKNRIDTVLATPHVSNAFKNRSDKIRSVCRNFNEVLKNERIALKVLPGAEVRIHSEMLAALDCGQLMTLNDAGKYLLLEMPDHLVPNMIFDLIVELGRKGIIPIIAHPERNLSLQNNLNWLDKLLYAGSLTQITAGSITGRFGRAAFKAAKKMLLAGSVDLVGSDAHSAFDRIPSLLPAIKKMEKIIGRSDTHYIQYNLPEQIIGKHDQTTSSSIIL